MAKRRDGGRPPGDYEVGYGKPPTATRFQKGTSGNPRGRPKAVRSIRERLATILARKVRLREGDKVRTMDRLDALLYRQVDLGLKGDARALAAICKLVEPDARRADAAESAAPTDVGADDLAMIRDFVARLTPASNEDDEEL